MRKNIQVSDIDRGDVFRRGIPSLSRISFFNAVVGTARHLKSSSIVFIASLALTGFFVQTAYAAPIITTTPTKLSFGNIKVGGSSAAKIVTIKNTGNATLIINSINIIGSNQSSFRQTNNCGTIEPAKTCTTNVVFSPSLPFGTKTASLSISSDDPKKPAATVALSGTAPAPVISAPASLAFGTIATGVVTLTKPATIKNTGMSDLIIGNISVSGTGASSFRQTNSCSVIPYNNTCTINVVFTPQIPKGSKVATLIIGSNDPKKTSASVKLTGTGPSDVTAPVSPSIVINSNAANTSSASVTLSISATDNIGVTGYYVSESNAVPSATAAGWVSVASARTYTANVPFTLSSAFTTKTVFAWFRDASGNISGAASDTIILNPPVCSSFTFTAWSACQPDNTQTRIVATSSPAGCTGGTPEISQPCTYVPPTCTSFAYSAWGACQPDNIQTRTVATSSPAGCTGGNPVLSEDCIYVPPSGTFRLPDTGQTKCYDAARNELNPCPLPGTARAQDGSYNINPMSFTDNGNGTIIDNNTNLIWQKCSAGQNSLTCSGTAGTYNWYQATGTVDETYNHTGAGYRNVCGELGTGWRMPTKKELVSIVDYSIPYPGPTIGVMFPNTEQSYYWSSTTYAYSSGYPGDAWYVLFKYGYIDFGYKGSHMCVRCVRSGH